MAPGSPRLTLASCLRTRMGLFCPAEIMSLSLNCGQGLGASSCHRGHGWSHTGSWIQRWRHQCWLGCVSVRARPTPVRDPCWHEPTRWRWDACNLPLSPPHCDNRTCGHQPALLSHRSSVCPIFLGTGLGLEIRLAHLLTGKLGLDYPGPVLRNCVFSFSLTLAPFFQLHSRAHPASDFPVFVLFCFELSASLEWCLAPLKTLPAGILAVWGNHPPKPSPTPPSPSGSQPSGMGREQAPAHEQKAAGLMPRASIRVRFCINSSELKFLLILE